MNQIDISIIIVSWNVKNLLKHCLESIYKNQGNVKLEVIVIDNASKDGSAEMVKENFPEINLIANQENSGFGRANNQGLDKAKGRYILLLNPDTIILPGNFELALKRMEENLKIGILGAQTLNPDMSLQPSIRRFPKFLPIFLIFIKIAKFFPNLKSLKNYFAVDFDYQKPQPVQQVAGSYMLVRKELIDEIGLFDENFFIWFEEVDLCRRTSLAGWEVYYDPEPKLIHYGGQSFKQEMTIRKQKLFFQSAWYYFRKHGFFKQKN